MEMITLLSNMLSIIEDINTECLIIYYIRLKPSDTILLITMPAIVLHTWTLNEYLGHIIPNSRDKIMRYLYVRIKYSKH